MASISNDTKGLRDRKKSRRRHEILDAARHLFEVDGYDGTTMARIADAAMVSTPTVFNYFGSKDQLIIEMVLEGHEAGRSFIRAWSPADPNDPARAISEMMCLYSNLTMDIAGKRVWRYAESTNIRIPKSPVTALYQQIEANHVSEIAAAIERFEHPSFADPGFLAGLIYDCWNAEFFRFIRIEDMTLAAHHDRVRSMIHKLFALISPPDGD